MSLNDVKSWLANPQREYSTGLKIYDAYKNTKKFDSFFRSIENPSPGTLQFNMLIQRVTDISRKLQQNPNLAKPEPISVKPIDIDELKKKSGQRINPIDPKRPRVVDNPLIEASQLPSEFQKLYFDNKNLTKEIGQQHQELKAVPAGENFNAKRKAIRDKLTSLDNLRAANWHKIDAWWVENKLKSDEQKQEFETKKDELRVSMQEAKAIFNRIDSLKINISREEKRIGNNAMLKEKLMPKINQWKTELAELEAKTR